MQEKFESARPPDSDDRDRLWEDATFVFDTNVLLNLYTYDKSTTEDLLGAIEALQDRLFMPHQVLIEFARNRESKIKQAHTPFDQALEFVDEWEEENAKLNKLAGQIEDRKNVRKDVLPLDDEIFLIEEEIEEIAAEIRDRIEESRERHIVTESTEPNPKDDPVLDALFDYFEGKVGDSYSQDQYEEILYDADQRASREIPPGYADIDDSDKDGDLQYGDQIIWNQIIDFASRQELGIVLVTGDSNKGDWREGMLRREFRRRVNEEFLLLEPTEFIKEANTRLGLQVAEDSIGAIEESEAEEDEKSIGEKFLSDEIKYRKSPEDVVDEYFREIEDQSIKELISSDYVLRKRTKRVMNILAELLEREMGGEEGGSNDKEE